MAFLQVTMVAIPFLKMRIESPFFYYVSGSIKQALKNRPYYTHYLLRQVRSVNLACVINFLF